MGGDGLSACPANVDGTTLAGTLVGPSPAPARATAEAVLSVRIAVRGVNPAASQARSSTWARPLLAAKWTQRSSAIQRG